MNKHRFHFVIDNDLLSKIDKFILEKSLKSRENAINTILDSMHKFVIKEISGGCPNQLSDVHEEPVDLSITVNINIEHFNKIRFLKYVFKTFSYATILRRLIRIFFDGIEIVRGKNCKVLITTHMNIFKSYLITISDKFLITKLTIPPI